MCFIVAIALVLPLVFPLQAACGLQQDDGEEDLEKIRSYLAIKFEGSAELPNGGVTRGLAYNEKARLDPVKIPELKTFLPKTRFFVSALDSPHFEYNPVEIVICVTRKESGPDIRSCLSPVFTTADPKFLSVFSGLPTKSPRERKKLVCGLGKLFAAVTHKGDVRAIRAETGSATIELLHGDLHWRTIELTFDQDGTSKNVIVNNPKEKF